MFSCLLFCVCGTFRSNFPFVSRATNRYFLIDSRHRMTPNRLNAKSNISRLRTIRFICFMHLLFSVSTKEPNFLSPCVSYGILFFFFRNIYLEFPWKQRSKISLLFSKPGIFLVLLHVLYL
jgi:hypothetical protein